MTRKRQRIVSVGARGQTAVIGLRREVFADLYHILLNKPWPYLLMLVVGGFLGTNALFGALYTLTGPCLANAHPGSFSESFFFSVQTMATIGYGFMYPTCTAANLLVTAESLLGLVSFAVVTGLAFNKFSRPRARVLFSRNAVISRHDGAPTLMFRVANERSNYVAEATLHLVLVKRETTAEGRPFTRMKDLELVRSRSSMFVLTWTALHQLTDDSPLAHETVESLKASGAIIVCTLTGFDSTIGQTIHARHIYAAQDIVFGARLVDILTPGRDGAPGTVDYNYFHDIEPEAAT